MFSETLSQTQFTLLPVLAMLLFAMVFVIVIVRVWRRGDDHPDNVHAARLPLDDDTIPTPNGGTHG